MAQENLGILIKLRQEGMQLLDQLIDGMEKAGGEAGEFRQRADALNADLRKLAEQQQDLIRNGISPKEIAGQRLIEGEKV